MFHLQFIFTKRKINQNDALILDIGMNSTFIKINISKNTKTVKKFDKKP
jgi:hypothetical protein